MFHLWRDSQSLCSTFPPPLSCLYMQGLHVYLHTLNIWWVSHFFFLYFSKWKVILCFCFLDNSNMVSKWSLVEGVGLISTWYWLEFLDYWILMSYPWLHAPSYIKVTPILSPITKAFFIQMNISIEFKRYEKWRNTLYLTKNDNFNFLKKKPYELVYEGFFFCKIKVCILWVIFFYRSKFYLQVDFIWGFI